MRLNIRHETLYRYGDPVKRSVQNLRLTPRRDPMQRVLNWRIAAPGRQHAQVDAHGNLVHLLTLDEPHREIRIVVEGEVETREHDGLLPDEGQLSPLAYLATTALTAPDGALADFARRHYPRGEERWNALLLLADAVCDAVRYEQGASGVRDSASLALTRGAGVCQDHAHVFIACCRTLGIPARYVSGYFFTTGGAGEVATHAWADAWLSEEDGWLSIDVTHRALAGERHCRLAVGRDYLDASPVRGVRRGGGEERLDVAVRVAQGGAQQ